MKKNEILEAYRFRHACKEFDPNRKIGEEDFAFILETGRLSPSSYGFEPWQFVVLQNMAIREKLLPITWGAQKTLPTASHYVLILSRKKQALLPDSEHVLHMVKDIRNMPAEGIERMQGVYRNFLEHDFELIDNDRAMFEWGCRQAYIALGNMMTAAAQIGIDSCPIEGFQKENVERLLAEEGILDRERFGLACMVAFGFRVRDPREKTRRPVEEVVSWVH